MSRIANIGASAVFLFLAVLLVLSRLATESFHLPLVFLGVSLILTLGLIYRFEGPSNAVNGLLGIVTFFITLYLWAVVTQNFYDPGFDGYAYHLSAIWDIGDGWNPLLSPHNNIWVDSYPNGYWVLQSYIVSVSGLLLSGQALLTGLAAATALLAYGFFLEHCAAHLSRFQKIGAILFAGLMVGNPVVVGQFLTHYVDGPLYLFGAALTLFLLSDALSPKFLTRLCAIGCIILMVNTKTAALYYVPLIVFGGFIVELALRHSDRKLFARIIIWIKNKGLLLGFSFVFGVIVIGYKPYVSNVQDHGKLLYPSVEKIMKGNEPSNMIPLSPPMKFFYGVFARTDHSNWPIDEPIELKIPGTFEISEFKYLRFDTRRGGFGPFFSLAFLAAIAAYLICRVAGRQRASYTWHREGDGFAIFGTILLTSSMFFPESWWARYVPFTWLSVLLFSIAALCLSGKGVLRAISRGLIGITLISLLGCILASGLGAIREGNLLFKRTEKIDLISSFPEVKLLMFYDPPAYQDFQSTSTQDGLSVWTRLLADKGIKSEITRERSQFDCDMAGYLNGGIYWCIVIDEIE